MDELENFMEQFTGKTKPTTYNLTFIVSPFITPTIVFGDNLEWLIEDSVGSAELGEILDKEEMNKIPSEAGLYSAEMVVQSFRCNHPEDPSEWDMTIKIDEIRKIL